MNLRRFTAILGTLFLLFVPMFVFAAEYSPLAPLPMMPSGTPTISAYLIALFRLGIGLAGLLAVVRLVYCGFKTVSSGTPSARQEAKQCLWATISGLLLAFSAWLILAQVNTALINASFNPAAIPAAPVGVVPPPTVPTTPPSCTVVSSRTSAKTGDVVSLVADCAPRATVLSWTSPPGTQPLYGVGGNIMFTTPGTYTYRVMGTNAAGEGIQSPLLSITIASRASTDPPPDTYTPDPVPSCTITTDKTHITEGESVQIAPSCTPQALAYTWTASDGAPIVYGTGGYITFPVAGTYTYTVTGMSGSGMGPQSTTVTIVVDAAPVPPPPPPYVPPTGGWGSTPPVTGGIKWNPGNYMNISGLVFNTAWMSSFNAQVDSICANNDIKGVQISKTWAALEGATLGDYSTGFSYMDQVMAKLNSCNKHLILRISERTFGAALTGMPNANTFSWAYPTYITSNVAYGGTAAPYGISWAPTGTTWGGSLVTIARMWTAPVMDRLIALSQAYGDRYNSNAAFEMVSLEETSFSLPDGADGFNAAAFDTQWRRWYSASAVAWPNSQVRISANYYGSDMNSLFAFCVSLGNCNVGGPDPELPLPDITRTITANRVFRGLDGGTDRRGVIPWVGEQQDMGVSVRYFETAADIQTYQNDTMHASYMIWRNDSSWTTPFNGGLSTLNQISTTGGAIGDTTCPTAFTRGCNGSGGGSDPTSSVSNSNGINWHPGHYALLAPFVFKSTADYAWGIHSPVIAQVCANSAWQGAELYIEWAAYEGGTAGDYTKGRALIQKYLDALSACGKHLQINPIVFNAYGTSCASIIPAYIINGAQYGVLTGNSSYDGTGRPLCYAKYWEQATMDRYIAWMQDLGTQFGSNAAFDGVFFWELSSGGIAAGTEAAIKTQVLRWLAATRAAMPKQQIRFTPTYWSNDAGVVEMLEACKQYACSWGGADDSIGSSVSTGNQIWAGMRRAGGVQGGAWSQTGTDYRGVIPLIGNTEWYRPADTISMNTMWNTYLNADYTTSDGVRVPNQRPSYMNWSMSGGNTTNNWNAALRPFVEDTIKGAVNDTACPTAFAKFGGCNTN